MNAAEAPDLAERILLLVATTKDAEASERILTDAGLSCRICKALLELCDEMERGGGAAVITQEAILTDGGKRLRETLERQPNWSDFPLIVLTPPGTERAWANRLLESVGHMTLMSRPVSVANLVSTIQAALRDRKRQYATRDYLLERERTAESLRLSQERLNFALEAGRLGSWDLDLATGLMHCSPTGKANFGLPPDGECTRESVVSHMHPEDRDGVQELIETALSTHRDYRAEYRNVRDDGSIHWVMARGRADLDADGRTPLRLAGVNLDITDLKLVEARLREDDRRKDEFLAMLAHELRNPLAAISNAVQVARRTDSAEHVEWAKEVIEGQVNHLSRLIEDLLDVSRITRGKIQLRRQRIDLGAIANQAVGTVRSLIAERRHRLSVTASPDRLMIDADPTRVEQILVNLLSNAAKYTEPGGRIEMLVERQGEENIVTVRDNGIGISAEQLPRMFELFVQGDRSIARSEGGLGIGLTLVKRLVEIHGGRIEAASPGLGQGSTFRVAFPNAAEVAGATAAAPPAAKPSSSSCTRILVVDDNVATARGMAKLLSLLGHEVRTAHDGHQAIDVAHEFCPQTVLLDIGLPGMDGYQVASKLRLAECCRDSMIIAISGYGQDEDRRRSREAGFDHHLVKPVNPDALMTLLSNE